VSSDRDRHRGKASPVRADHVPFINPVHSKMGCVDAPARGEIKVALHCNTRIRSNTFIRTYVLGYLDVTRSPPFPAINSKERNAKFQHFDKR
jgi:hypothetical protein